jgi:hypothetical protein
LEPLVDSAAPITFGQLAARFAERGMTKETYAAFRLPLSFEDITNPALADEIVAYRRLITYA